MNRPLGIDTSEIWLRKPGKLDPSLPQLLFCPECGSLEVFITRGHNNSILTCLDCKMSGWLN